MQCFIIAAMTADGYIAKDDKHSPFGWNSKEDKKRFVELTKKAGVIVMGSSTYKTLPGLLKERVNIVYSRKETFPGAEMTEDSPSELLKKLEARGFKEVAICGGAAIYNMFMQAKVVDRLFITIEPLLFGSGIRLFSEDMLFHLKLISTAQTESGTLLLEYAVDYSGTAKA